MNYRKTLKKFKKAQSNSKFMFVQKYLNSSLHGFYELLEKTLLYAWISNFFAVQ